MHPDFYYAKKQAKKLLLEISYCCECGKRYDNFPALYLHFQKKHDSNVLLKECLSKNKFEKKNGMLEITYFLNQ